MLRRESMPALHEELKQLERLKLVVSPPPNPAAPHPPDHESIPFPAQPNPDLGRSIDHEVANKIRALSKKGYVPPLNIDALLESLDSETRRFVDSVAVHTKATGHENGD
jgi:hypothetical protein